MKKIKLFVKFSFDISKYNIPLSEIETIYKEFIKEKIILYSKNKGIFLTDHDYRNVVSVSNRMYVIKNGKNILINDLEGLRKVGYICD